MRPNPEQPSDQMEVTPKASAAPQVPKVVATARVPDGGAQEPLVRLPESEDYYYEGKYLVFTAAFHLKRGSCCHSDCRHCPYGNAGQGEHDLA